MVLNEALPESKSHGKLVEHWDVMQEEVPAFATASGNPMFTRP
jgi:predicted SnoaL-like aldol condensation-catalyzing enzyme